MTTAKPTESQQLDRLSHDLGIQFAYPNSDKIYLSGSRADMRVPLRQIRQADTVSAQGREPNPPIPVYDTSGPYGDPNAEIDLKQGLADVRGTWIAERGDTEQLAGLSSEYGQARARPANSAPAFQPNHPPAARPKRQKRNPNALRAARHHHAGNGICGAARAHEAR